MNLDVKIAVWNVLVGVMAALIIFLVLNRKSRSEKKQKKSESQFKQVLVAVTIIGAVGVLFYLLLLPERAIVRFPSTGPEPTSQIVSSSLESPYFSSTDGLITLALVTMVAILAIVVTRNVRQLREIDKAKTEFVSLASHQLRTPLTAIGWYSEMILEGDAGPVNAEQKKYIEEIYEGNKRMIELVNTLLDVSRIELGTFVIEPIPTDISALAANILDELKPEIEKKNIIVKKNFDSKMPILLADPKLLSIVLVNLLSNAVEYSRPGGEIELNISQKETTLIKVSDKGYGIPKKQQDQIFTKLFRADNVKSKGINGTGLGLYIVKSIVENSGGKIWFESEENKGTTFSVALPLKRVDNK